MGAQPAANLIVPAKNLIKRALRLSAIVRMPRLAPQRVYVRDILVQPLGKRLQQLARVRVPEDEGGREPQHHRKERIDDIVCARPPLTRNTADICRSNVR
jgi:hypothetical protein